MSSRVNSMLPLPLYGDVRNIDGQIAFLPSRYLVSYGKDSTLRFWKWWEDRRSPGANPRFVRQENAFVVDMPEISDADGCNCKGECKCRVVCSDFSPGGSFFATGKGGGREREGGGRVGGGGGGQDHVNKQEPQCSSGGTRG